MVPNYGDFSKFGVQLLVGLKNQPGDKEVATLVISQSQLNFNCLKMTYFKKETVNTGILMANQ